MSDSDSDDFEKVDEIEENLSKLTIDADCQFRSGNNEEGDSSESDESYVYCSSVKEEFTSQILKTETNEELFNLKDDNLEIKQQNDIPSKSFNSQTEKLLWIALPQLNTPELLASSSEDFSCAELFQGYEAFKAAREEYIELCKERERSMKEEPTDTQLHEQLTELCNEACEKCEAASKNYVNLQKQFSTMMSSTNFKLTVEKGPSCSIAPKKKIGIKKISTHPYLKSNKKSSTDYAKSLQICATSSTSKEDYFSTDEEKTAAEIAYKNAQEACKTFNPTWRSSMNEFLKQKISMKYSWKSLFMEQLWTLLFSSIKNPTSLQSEFLEALKDGTYDEKLYTLKVYSHPEIVSAHNKMKKAQNSCIELLEDKGRVVLDYPNCQQLIDELIDACSDAHQLYKRCEEDYNKIMTNYKDSLMNVERYGICSQFSTLKFRQFNSFHQKSLWASIINKVKNLSQAEIEFLEALKEGKYGDEIHGMSKKANEHPIIKQAYDMMANAREQAIDLLEEKGKAVLENPSNPFVTSDLLNECSNAQRRYKIYTASYEKCLTAYESEFSALKSEDVSEEQPSSVSANDNVPNNSSSKRKSKSADKKSDSLLLKKAIKKNIVVIQSTKKSDVSEDEGKTRKKFLIKKISKKKLHEKELKEKDAIITQLRDELKLKEKLFISKETEVEGLKKKLSKCQQEMQNLQNFF